jgi:hypothetical protein
VLLKKSDPLFDVLDFDQTNDSVSRLLKEQEVECQVIGNDLIVEYPVRCSLKMFDEKIIQ